MGTSVAAKNGGLKRILLHGNPGTVEGRRLGGLRSVASQSKKGTGFIQLRSVSFPRDSSKFAELLGILAGDGHVGLYQTTMTTNSTTDYKHALYTKDLFSTLFNIPVSLYFRKNKKACVVVASSKEVSRFLVKKGLVQGHKIRGSLCMPAWVGENILYKKAFIRGLFDTDGCVFIDTHRIKNREYKNIAMSFTNRSLPLLNDFKQALETFNLHPTQKTKYTVFLRREADIQRYFALVGSSNPKHMQKFITYFSLKNGGVA